MLIKVRVFLNESRERFLGVYRAGGLDGFYLKGFHHFELVVLLVLWPIQVLFGMIR